MPNESYFVCLFVFKKSNSSPTGRQMESLVLLFCRKDLPGTGCISSFREQNEVPHIHFYPRLPQSVPKKWHRLAKKGLL